MNTDDWNLLLGYAEGCACTSTGQHARHEVTLVRFRQWLREQRIAHEGFTP